RFARGRRCGGAAGSGARAPGTRRRGGWAMTAAPADAASPCGRQPVLEALVVLAVTLPLAVGLRYPTLWLVVPFAVITLAGRSYERYGLSWRRPGSLRFHLCTATVIFGGY